MDQKFTQQEVLLHTATGFAHRQWADKDANGSENLTAIQKLEKACWDGLVKELIPELNINLSSQIKLWLWQVHETKSFLALDFYEYPGPKEKEYSIDPYIFLDKLRSN
jgi:hypothetical protein